MAARDAPEEAFVCAKAAEALLNCVAAKNYNELKCVPLVKKLRECVEKEGVVGFALLPDKPARRPDQVGQAASRENEEAPQGKSN